MADRKAYPRYENVEGFRVAEKIITFDGGTAGEIGDDGGALDPFTIFTVTGIVAARVFGVCTTDLVSAGGGTLEVGATKDVNGLIVQTTATTLTIGEIWHDASPDNSIELLTVAAENILTQSVIGTVGTGDITAGVIKFICLWKPLSGDGNVKAA